MTIYNVKSDRTSNQPNRIFSLNCSIPTQQQKIIFCHNSLFVKHYYWNANQYNNLDILYKNSPLITFGFASFSDETLRECVLCGSIS
ncbi:hypothetical protein [Nostoc sp. FACHB-133]|uniref:hypothetical protein n=1 Tax=Nostoc sp. FACHB-133 TaxID=2692835 RepID=UPI0016882172|nr:hypothetical protein [Nostoc sp. FACHB-133]MBD2521338.1 hypothetical protein [Nostoc sp. FACHB-133]